LNRISELAQIFYEISMTIGADLSLERMLNEFGMVTLRKLNCTALCVLEERTNQKGHYFERIFLTPKSFKRGTLLAELEALFPYPLTPDELESFYGSLPRESRLSDSTRLHLMHLPGYGLIAIFRARGSFTPEVIESFQPINRKLAVACRACVAHRQLEDSEEKYRSLIHTMQEGVAIISPSRKFAFANSSLATMLGCDLSGIIGEPVESFLDAHNLELLKRHKTECNKGRKVSYDLVWKKKDGEPLYSHTSHQLIMEPNETEPSCLLIVTDMSLQKQMELQIQQNEKMEALGIMAGGIAHDFNNICAVITGNISYALSSIVPDTELHEVLIDVQNAANNAKNLTTQLLTFSKGGSPVKTTAQLNEIIVESASFMLRGSNSKCEFDLEKDLWACEVDTGQFSQVICNLVLNASQAMPDGGIIDISTRNVEIDHEESDLLQPGRYIRITIKDKGQGIAEENISRIFDPFFSTKHSGSGLGLATAYSIISNHDGQITAYSEAGKGAMFSIYLPALAEGVKADVGSASVKGGMHKGKGRILVMDDQDFVLKMAGRLLKSMGYEVVLTMDGEEAVEKYRQAHEAGDAFSLVILDITVPGGMGGTKALGEMLKINPKVKAVVSSGYSRDPIMANYREHGFSGVVPKPYTISELAHVIKKLISSH